MQLDGPLAAEPPIELGVFLLEGGFLGVDEVRPVVAGAEAEVVALFELLGQEGLFQPDDEDGDVALLFAEDLHLLAKRQCIGGMDRRGGKQRGGKRRGLQETSHHHTSRARGIGTGRLLGVILAGI